MRKALPQALHFGAKVALLAVLLQLVFVFVAFVLLPRGLATNAVMYFYFPVVMLLSFVDIVRQAPLVKIVVFIVPVTGMMTYSAFLGVLATMLRRYRAKIAGKTSRN